MKIEFSFKVSLGILILVLLLSIASLVVFSSKYSQNAAETRLLISQYAQLQLQNSELEKYGEWTLNYFRIKKTLDAISAEKISAKTRNILTEQLWQISKTYDIDPILILAIVLQESRGNPNTRGRYQSGAESGAYGLMQLKVETAQTLAKKFAFSVESSEDLMKPEVNVVLGTAYLMRLIGHYQDVRHAVIAYNLGQGKVDRLLAEGRELPSKYYEGVMSKYRTLEKGIENLLLEQPKDSKD